MHLTFTMIQQAWERKDPTLVDYIVQLAEQDIPEPDTPIRDEALTFERFLIHIFSDEFRKQPEAIQKAYRQEQIALLEADDAEVPLPEQLKLHRIILLIASDSSYYARCTLLDIIRRIPLIYGPWKAIKHLYKVAESQHDYELLGAIAARFDTSDNRDSVSHPTGMYMTRRAWRYLRKLGESLPVCYAEAAVHYLAAYTDDTDWQQTWIANHIFHHQTKKYSRHRFAPIRKTKHYRLTHRAFKESWQRSPEPLFHLMQIARSEAMREYSSEALMVDFAIPLRNVETDTIIALMAIPEDSQAVDNFIVWLLKQASRYEQHQFRELGLHEGVLALLHSKAADALSYACDYLRAHARDLALDKLILLANNSQKTVRTLAQQIIAERDPRKDIGLDAWGELLESEHANSFASKALLKHFGRKELTSDWFSQRLLAATYNSVNFAKAHLLELHPLKSLGTAFFQTVLEPLDNERDEASSVARFALEQLETLGVAELPSEFIQTFLLNPLTQHKITQWLENEDIKLTTLPIDYCKALAYEPDWQQSSFVKSLKDSNQTWAKDLTYNEDLATTMRSWLADVRRINPSELGFAWLMQLISREESHYSKFATQRMIKAFLPADFSPDNDTSDNTASTESDEEKTIDLDGQTFVFTGKLMTMTRKEAQGKVTTANGKNATAVNGKLNYLVIGDDGSPMYGHGRKGSKQLKAESLIEGGANLKVISETAFLQMLAGEQREFSDDSISAGCETLWSMMVDAPDTPIGKFAYTYLRYHHPKICLVETDRPVDPGAEIPEGFLSFERFEPLLQHDSAPLRRFALEFSRWEFARWSPSSTELIRLCESKHKEVREFVSKALLDEADNDNRHYVLDASQLEASAVYSFCESKDASTRQLGMTVIRLHDKFQQPDALFQLTESPDRELRAFVIRVLWSQYKRYETTRHWQPYQAEPSELESQQQKKARLKREQEMGTQGLPIRPEQLPANAEALEQLLSRWLYELPPGRLGHERLSSSLKPLSASAAKKALIETLRDLALDDADFAQRILPLLENFTRSRGAMEKAACLVAVTRIYHVHPQLSKAA